MSKQFEHNCDRCGWSLSYVKDSQKIEVAPGETLDLWRCPRCSQEYVC